MKHKINLVWPMYICMRVHFTPTIIIDRRQSMLMTLIASSTVTVTLLNDPWSKQGGLQLSWKQLNIKLIIRKHTSIAIFKLLLSRSVLHFLRY